MAENKQRSKNSKRVKGKVKSYTLKAIIADDQREYVEGVREWLHDSLSGKGKIVGGPI